MDKAHYDKLQGIDVLNTSLAAPQMTFRELINFYVNKELGALEKRGGSTAYSVTGNLWGISGYAFNTGTARQPLRDTPIRHRRVGTTSYIEKLDLNADTWSAITQGSNTSFDIGNVMTTAQIKDLLCLCAGRPAKLSNINSGSVERLGGPAPTTAATTATGAAGVLTGTYRHVYTFKDETSGWESSPSPASTAVVASSDKIELTDLAASGDRDGITHLYIYRTINTNEEPYRYSGKVTIPTTTYSDNIADASLGEAAPVAEDHDEPPTDAYICAGYKQRLWIPDGNAVYYSQADDGTGTPLEYYSPNRVIRVDNKVTALIPNRNGGLYIFSPPAFGIKEVVGRFSDDQDFEVVDAFPREGTYFHTSVASGGANNDLIAYWGGNGPRFITADGISDRGAEQVNAKYEIALSGEFSSNIFAWSQWDALRENFIMAIVALDAVEGGWINSSSGAPEAWENSATSTEATWE